MIYFGFIGVGNMGGAIAMAVARTRDPGTILVSALHPQRAEDFSRTYGTVPSTNLEIAARANFIFLGVKPQYMEEVLLEIGPTLQGRKDLVLVTMAAGLTMENITRMAGCNCPVIRIMPNTPAKVGQGMIQYDYNEQLSPQDLEIFLEAMKAAGRLDHLPERLIDAGSAVSGCGPAFVCLFLEALADGGVACGLPRAKALEYGAQMLLGTARLVLESGEHPGVLKDQVCSPGGSTIQGVRALEAGGLRSAVMEAVMAAYKKNQEFAK